DRVLLGNADVEGPMREGLAEDIDAGAARHRGGDRDDLVVLLRLLHEALAEYFSIRRRVRLGLDLLAGGNVELYTTVILVGGGRGGGVPLALLRHHVDENRPFLGVADVLEDGQQVIEIVAIDRPDIEEAHLFEQRAASDKTARVFFHRARALL